MKAYGSEPGSNFSNTGIRDVYLVLLAPDRAFLHDAHADRTSGLAHPDSYIAHTGPFYVIPPDEPLPPSLKAAMASPPTHDEFAVR